MTVRRDKRGRRIGYNWWREYNTELWFAADQAWLMRREEAAIGYATEEAEFAAENPRPTLKHMLLNNKGMNDDR